MISLSKIAAVEERCGKLIQVGANGKLTRFNEQGAAALFASVKEVVFAMEENRYYIYAPHTGLWEPKSREEMLSALDFFLHESGRRSCPWTVWKTNADSPYCPVC